MNDFNDFTKRDEGQTMTEYAVILGVITPATIAALALLALNVEETIGLVVDLFT